MRKKKLRLIQSNTYKHSAKEINIKAIRNGRKKKRDITNKKRAKRAVNRSVIIILETVKEKGTTKKKESALRQQKQKYRSLFCLFPLPFISHYLHRRSGCQKKKKIIIIKQRWQSNALELPVMKPAVSLVTLGGCQMVNKQSGHKSGRSFAGERSGGGPPPLLGYKTAPVLVFVAPPSALSPLPHHWWRAVAVPAQMKAVT